LVAIHDIVVHCDNARACESRLITALRLAQTLDAQLTGHFALQSVNMMAFAEGGASGLLYDQEIARLEEGNHRAEQLFIRVTDAVKARWVADKRPMFEGMSSAARQADLAVVGLHDDTDPHCTSRNVAVHIALTAGVPVLVLPAWEKPPEVAAGFGRRVLVAWNDTRESVRALHDSMPFLARADEVLIASVDGELADLEAVCAHVKEHGIAAKPSALSSRGDAVQDVLLAQRDAMKADLVVLGAYGHSRMREFVLGGVTRTLLGEATTPLLISH
jgi:nucleotide-binding universal stress UspA family protein